MKNKRVYSKYTEEALRLLSKQIKLGRKKKHWSEADLSERAGVSRATLQKIEKGHPGCAIGLFFEVAVLVGVQLFAADTLSLTRYIEQTDDKLAVLPKTIRSNTLTVDDDF